MSKIYDSDGFPRSLQTWGSWSKENYFKILNAAKERYPEEINKILKTKKSVEVINPLTKRDLLGIIVEFELEDNFPNYNKANIDTLRTKFMNLVESESNQILNSYLVSEGLFESAINTEKKEIKTEKTIHNKTKKLLNFIMSQILDIDLTEPTKEKAVKEEPEEIEEVEIEEVEVEEEEVKDTEDEMEIEEAIEEVEEEDMLLDCIEDYKSEFGVKTVKTNTKKFKEFYENWKKSS